MSGQEVSSDSQTDAWEGLHGLRYTGIGRIAEMPTPDEVSRWIESAGLLPKKEYETDVEWDRRTNGGYGPLVVKQTVEKVDTEGEQNGAE